MVAVTWRLRISTFTSFRELKREGGRRKERGREEEEGGRREGQGSGGGEYEGVFIQRNGGKVVSKGGKGGKEEGERAKSWTHVPIQL